MYLISNVLIIKVIGNAITGKGYRATQTIAIVRACTFSFFTLLLVHLLFVTSLFQQCHQHCSLVNHKAPCQGIRYVLLPLRLLHLHWKTTRHQHHHHHHHRPCRRHHFQQQHHPVLNLPQCHPVIKVHDIIKAIPFPVYVIAVARDGIVDTRLLALLTSLSVSYLSINVKQLSASLCSNMALFGTF